MIAGPKTLEHMVDGVFYLQGEDRWQTRILVRSKIDLAQSTNWVFLGNAKQRLRRSSQHQRAPHERIKSCTRFGTH